MLSYEQVLRSLVEIGQDICKIIGEVSCCSLLMGAINILRHLGPRCVVRSLVEIGQDFCKIIGEVSCCSLLMGAINILRHLGPRCIWLLRRLKINNFIDAISMLMSWEIAHSNALN